MRFRQTQSSTVRSACLTSIQRREREALHKDHALREAEARRSGWHSCYSRDLIAILFESSGILAPGVAALVGIAGASIGFWLTGAKRRARVVVPFSAGVLLGV